MWKEKLAKDRNWTRVQVYPISKRDKQAQIGFQKYN